MSWFRLILAERSAWISQQFVSNVLTGGIVGQMAFDNILMRNSLYKRVRDATAVFVSEKISPHLRPLSRDMAVVAVHRVIEGKKFSLMMPELFERYHNLSIELSKAECNCENLSNPNQYSPRPQIEVVTAPKPRGWIDRKDPNIINMGVLPIVQPRKLSRESKPQFVTAGSIANDESLIPIENDEKSPVITKQGIQKFVNFLFDNYVLKETIQITSGIKACLIDRDEFAIMTREGIAKTLLPVCEKAVHASIAAFIRDSAALTFDNTVRRAVSITQIPLIYSIAVNALETFADIRLNDATKGGFHEILPYLPSTSTVLGISVAYHLAGVAKVFLRARFADRSNTPIDQDKREVKWLVYKITKDPIKENFQSIRLFKALKIALGPKKTDALIRLLIDETLDFYWDDLHKVEYFDIPLVS